MKLTPSPYHSCYTTHSHCFLYVVYVYNVYTCRQGPSLFFYLCFNWLITLNGDFETVRDRTKAAWTERWPVVKNLSVDTNVRKRTCFLDSLTLPVSVEVQPMNILFCRLPPWTSPPIRPLWSLRLRPPPIRPDRQWVLHLTNISEMLPCTRRN